MIFTLSKSPAILTPGFAVSGPVSAPRTPPRPCPPPRCATTGAAMMHTPATTATASPSRVMCGSSEVQLVRSDVALGKLADDAQDAVGKLDVLRGAALTLL